MVLHFLSLNENGNQNVTNKKPPIMQGYCFHIAIGSFPCWLTVVYSTEPFPSDLELTMRGKMLFPKRSLAIFGTKTFVIHEQSQVYPACCSIICSVWLFSALECVTRKFARFMWKSCIRSLRIFQSKTPASHE